jgi:hypothetical protein
VLSLKVINLYAAPGVGKSTLAAGLFNLLKQLGYSVELVTEYAKDLTWEERRHALTNQLYILAKQDAKLRRLEGQVEWCITDSPLPLGMAYMSPEYEQFVPAAIWGAFRRYQNYHVLLKRNPDRPYVQAGRNQTEAESMRLDTVIDNIYGWASDDDPEERRMETISDHAAPYRVLEMIEGAELT